MQDPLYLWLINYLREAEFYGHAGAIVIVMAVLLPAYRRTKNLGLRLWIVADSLSLVNSVSVHHFTTADHATLTSRQTISLTYPILYFICLALGLAGSLNVLKTFVSYYRMLHDYPPLSSSALVETGGGAPGSAA